MKTILKRSSLTLTMFLVTFLCISQTARAQYNFALGLRAGGSSGVTLKHFYTNDHAIEGILGFWGNGFSATGMWEKHLQVSSAPGLKWYYGPGLHVAYYNVGYPNNNLRDTGYRDNDAIGFGINGIIGLEYRLPDGVPIAFSLDMKPFLEIDTHGQASVALDPSIGVKLIFK